MKLTQSLGALGLSLAVLGVSACSGGGGGNQAGNGDGSVALRVGHIFPAASPIHQSAEAWAKEVSEETEGRVEVTVFPGGQLGTDVEMGEGLQNGSVECSLINYAAAGIDPKLQLSFMPYIVTNYEMADELFYGDGFVAAHDRALLKERNITTLTFYENDFRGLTNSVRDIRHPNDLAGLKIRVPETPMYVEMFKAWGAQPLAMAFPELYTALQQGTVDGQDNGLALSTDSKFGEVQKHMTLTNHAYGTGALVCHEGTWNKVGENDQKKMVELAEKMSADMRKTLRDGRPDRMKTLEEQGVTVIELSDSEMAEFAKIKDVIWPQFEDTFGSDVLQGLRDASEGATSG